MIGVITDIKRNMTREKSTINIASMANMANMANMAKINCSMVGAV